jgi:hypothetical protein
MRKNLDAYLVRKYPLLYKARHKDMTETCMCWGFNVNNGWYQLIKRLSVKLEKMIQAMPAEEQEHYYAQQVKEKYSQLRFYMLSSTDEMEKAIEEAEKESAVTCEKCGRPGKLIEGGMKWLMTRCDVCISKMRRRGDPVRILKIRRT